MIQNVDIIQLTEKMHESKQDLLNFIAFYFDEWSDEYFEVSCLVQTNQDIQGWLNLWDGNVDDIHNHNMKFRRWKLDQISFNYDYFVDLLVLDIEDFISTFFQQEYISRYVIELKEFLDYVSVMELFKLKKENPYSRLEYLIR